MCAFPSWHSEDPTFYLCAISAWCRKEINTFDLCAVPPSRREDHTFYTWQREDHTFNTWHREDHTFYTWHLEDHTFYTWHREDVPSTRDIVKTISSTRDIVKTVPSTSLCQSVSAPLGHLRCRSVWNGHSIKSISILLFLRPRLDTAAGAWGQWNLEFVFDRETFDRLQETARLLLSKLVFRYNILAVS